jgi:hypothetical protein
VKGKGIRIKLSSGVVFNGLQFSLLTFLFLHPLTKLLLIDPVRNFRTNKGSILDNTGVVENSPERCWTEEDIPKHNPSILSIVASLVRRELPPPPHDLVIELSHFLIIYQYCQSVTNGPLAQMVGHHFAHRCRGAV